jgi:hypothetical protein
MPVKNISLSAAVFVAALAIGCGAVVFYFNAAAAPLPFKPITPQAFAGLVGWLTAVAVFVERAVEVLVLVMRDHRGDVLGIAEEQAAEAVQRATVALPSPASTATPQQIADANQALQSACAQLAAAHEQSVVYRAETKEFALKISLVFSLAVSLAGVRALHGLIPDAVTVGQWFSFVDIAITSALLAGGSEGVHRMANVVTSFADGLSTQLDQKNQK